MNTTTRIAGFAVVLVAAVAIGAGVGATVGPEPTDTRTEAPAPIGQGVVSARDGYQLAPDSPVLRAAGGTFRFRVLDPDGNPTTRFAPVHERDLHLIVVNRELTHYQHVHPTLADNGTWTVELDALPPGSYRAIADFQVADGPRLALGTDLGVAGEYDPRQLPEPDATSVVDGYQVTLATERGDGGEVIASLTVTRASRPVADLEPYLGANGHLVAIRTGDLAYAHVHPVDDGHDFGPPADGTVTFDAALDAAGRYGLFFDFQHDGVVRTAAFTLDQGTVTGANDMEH
ncbi:MAG: hypothetical protein AB7Q42_08265 [Acidimicrobiia bacterium]